MSKRFFRDSFVGRLTYNLSGHKYLTHPEEQHDYVVPSKYLCEGAPNASSQSVISEKKDDASEEVAARVVTNELDNNGDGDTDGRILVDWDSEDDPENPQNWPRYQKVLFLTEIGVLTTSIYIGSSIYTPGIQQLMDDMNVGQVVAILPMSLFVLAYGIGQMIFSPMSEHPAIGRTNIYIITLIIFVILQIPTALVRDIASLCVLRFLAGFFASPALSTGGASVGDVVSLPNIPIGLAAWSLCAVCGPVFGPLFGGIFSQLVDVYWCFWFLLILGGSTLLVLAFLLPESSKTTLLYRKAQRLQKVTGNHRIISQGHLQIESQTMKEMAVSTLWRPIEIALKEPMVMSLNLYIGLVYSVLYTFFEAFPIVLEGIHHFTKITQGVSFLSVAIGCWVGCLIYILVINEQFKKPLRRGISIEPEVFMFSAIVGAFFMPVGIFIFAWTSSYHTHWIGTLFGAGIFSLGAFVIFQTMFNFLAFGFPRYIASVFASSGLFRSVFACAFPLFANIMYRNLGPKEYPVGWGCTILGIVGVLMIAIPVVLYKYGKQLRGNSRYAN